ncbi:ATP-binding protein [Streptomyces europaeiscabiei]|uniref:ATP-binding protein n=1 Tax=Streptomyces TaxID=1883 RepID=UPI00211AD78C|nr:MULTISPECIES: ATP-binding protein [Streptomyces]WUD32502.1 ATP-binding protein [Streptomyces europaeiscabiei]
MSEGLVLLMEFDGAELPLVRSLVEEAALRARLATAVTGAFVQAVSEIATNAAVHGGGASAVELRVVAGELRCEVTDSGRSPATARGARAASRRVTHRRRRHHRPYRRPQHRPGHHGHPVHAPAGPRHSPARALNQAAT